MEVDTPESQELRLQFTKTLKESELDSVINELLGNIDYQKLQNSPNLIRVNHPLLLERMGAEVSVNNEIINLIRDMLEKLTSSDDDDFDLLKFEETLITAAKDEGKMRLTLLRFNVIVTLLTESDRNNDQIVREDINRRFKARLETPSAIQTQLIYPVVTADINNQDTSNLLTILREKRKQLLAELATPIKDPDGLIAEGIKNEAAIVEKWIHTRPKT